MSISLGEGLAFKEGSSFSYQYNLTDHLGNVRNVLNASNVSVQSNDYYPFGLTHTSPTNFAKNKYLYNGKEAQDETIGGTVYNVLDYGARRYDPVIVRFDRPDRFTEKYVSLSPFQYVGNNPICNIDINGDSMVVAIEKIEAWDNAKKIVEQGTGGKYTLANRKNTADGMLLGLKLVDGNVKLNDQELAFYNDLKDVIDGNGIAYTSWVYNDPNVEIGNYETSQIDIGDISQFNNMGEGGATKQGKFSHEMVEQMAKSRGGYGKGSKGSSRNRDDSHAAGIRSENRVNGNKRLKNETDSNPTRAVQRFEQGQSIIRVEYTRGNSNMKVNQIKIK